MIDNYVQVAKDNRLRLTLVTEDQKPTGEYLEFDLEDISLPLKYQELVEKDKKNRVWLKNQFLIIDKKQDVKGKKLLSKNDEDRIKAVNDFVAKEIEVYNMFLGDNGVEKLLNGRKPNWSMFDEINQIIEEQITPYIEKAMGDITNKIKEKYGTQSNKEDDK